MGAEATTHPTIEAALLALASVDRDYATQDNGVGYNGRDTTFGNSLAGQLEAGRRLSPRQRSAAFKMLRTYRVQLLRDHGLDYDAIPDPTLETRRAEIQQAQATAADPDRAWGTIDVGPDKRAVLRSPYNARLVEMVRAIPGRTWDREEKRWTFPIDRATVERIRQISREFRLQVTGLEALEAEERAMLASIEASRALDADITIPDFGTTVLQPRPYQRGGVAYLIGHGNCIVGDEMGLGKTITALGWAQHQQAFPLLVICPKKARRGWNRMASGWINGRKVEVLSGRTAAPTFDLETADIVIVNYDVLGVHHDEEWLADHAEEPAPAASWVDVLGAMPWAAIVIDEGHRIMHGNSQRARACKALKDQAPARHALTGTAIMNRPVELLAQLDFIGRLEDVSRAAGWDGTGSAWRYYMVEFVHTARRRTDLHRALRATCFVRRTQADVRPEMPPVQQETVVLELRNRGRYEEIERDVMIWLREKVDADATFQGELDALAAQLREDGADDEEVQRALGRKRQQRLFTEQGKAYGPAAALVKFNAMKQVCAEEKLEAAFAWIDDFLANSEGAKISIFTHHQAITNAFAERYQAPMIKGGISEKAAGAAEDRFQSDPSCRVIVLSEMAASEALTLTAAHHTFVFEYPWRPGDLAQCYGRHYGRENDPHGLTAYLGAADGTVDEDIAEIIAEKAGVVGEVLDGKAREEAEQTVLGDLLRRLEARAVARVQARQKAPERAGARA